jgi:hypothetical protein
MDAVTGYSHDAANSSQLIRAGSSYSLEGSLRVAAVGAAVVPGCE